MQLRFDPLPTNRTKSKSKAAKASLSSSPAATQLFEQLRKKRMQLAKEQGVPPYVIFHDASLREMIERRPQSLQEFGTISGVGERKLEKYGAAFLEVLLQHA